MRISDWSSDVCSSDLDHDLKTMTEQAATANWMKQMADIGLIVGSIRGAVFFTLLLLTGNTMAQAVRERIPELAVLKTIGFRDGAVLGLVLAESVLLVLIGGVLGLGLAAGLAPAITTVSGGVISMPAVDAGSWLLGRSEEHTSELQSLMRNSYAVFCLKKKTQQTTL